MIKEHVSYSKKAIKGVTHVTILLFISHVLSYILRVVLARQLTPEEYGLFSAVFELVLFLLVFRDFGLGNALVKFIPQYKHTENYSKIKTMILSAGVLQLVASLLLIAILIFMAPYLSTHYFKSGEAKSLLIVLSWYILFSMLARLLDNILNGFQEVKWYSWTQTLKMGFTVIFSIVLIYYGFGVMSPAIAYIVALFLTFLILAKGASKYVFILKYPLTNVWKTTKELFTFAGAVIFTGLGNKVVAHLDVLILAYFVPLAQVGVYNVVLPTALLFLFIPRAVTMILFPMTSELWAKDDVKRVSEGVRLIHTYLLFLTQPFVFAVFVYAEEFITLFFGQEYVSGALAFQILLFGVLLEVISAANESIISASGRPYKVTVIILISAAVNIVLNFILIPRYGIVGAALATAASYGTALILSTYALLTFVRVSSPFGIWIKSLFAGVLFLITLNVVKQTIAAFPLIIQVLISLVAAVAVYGVIGYWLRIVYWKEVKRYASLLLEK